MYQNVKSNKILLNNKGVVSLLQLAKSIQSGYSYMQLYTVHKNIKTT